MHFHYCGSPVHDLVTNVMLVMANLPDWLPLARLARGYLKARHR